MFAPGRSARHCNVSPPTQARCLALPACSSVKARSLAKHAPTAIGGLVACTLVFGVFHDVDRARVTALIAGTGAPLLFALVPQAVSLLSETLGWQRLVASLGYRLSLLPLLRVRIATEALCQSLPAGVVWCESMKPVLLQRHAALPVTAGVGAAAARKYARLWSHAGYISLAFVLGYATLRRLSESVIGIAGLEWFVLATALILIAASAGMALGLSRSALALRLHGLLARLPRIGRRLAERRAGFVESDAHMARVGRLSPRELVGPVLACLIAWCTESVETLIVLRMLGVDIGFDQALAIEATVSFARQLFFFVPAGIGVQDAGYVGFLTALGVPAALEVGAAFTLVKRARELVYTALGLGLLVAPPLRMQGPAVTADSA